MTDDLNVLILSCGTRNKIVQYFKSELAGKGMVMATDCSILAPALYEADKYFIVPRMNEDGYLEHILKICRDNKIKAVLSLIDPELSLLAENKQAFLDIGTLPIVSNLNIVEMSFDKYKMFEFMIQNGFSTVQSYIDEEQFYDCLEKGEISFPVFVKPVKGSASLNINKVTTKQEIKTLYSQFDNLMIQEYMNGSELGADVYIDMLSEEPVSIFIKEKLKMRAGETDKSVSYKDEKLFELIRSFVLKAGFKGIIDIDIFKVNDEYYISEVNPRFGGGFPHAYECGVNVPKMIINNVKGYKNSNTIGNYEDEVYMMKFNEVKILKK
ncbi:ATP-grasp domain-containing protein [Planococcus ruber]|uniref:ATP-grasp domain-containing protein n=1 Tax=Planococcus ruber TaxID=2027871 RepID=UPI001FED3376|nr:ATP-grasp domain-containing protein [Planococcus ruber]MCJ1908275.1 ATP-grasp domain-containing protein [Planococcus ruber]